LPVRRAGALLAVLLLRAAALAGEGSPPLPERALLENINAARVGQGLPRLEIDRELSAFARRRAEEVLQPGGSDVPIVGEALHRRARGFGYDARFLAELILESEDDDLAAIEAAWAEGNPGRPLALNDSVRDLGVGVARRGEVRGYVLLFGLSARTAFEEKTRGLPDAASLSREMLGRVNELRRSAGVPPLRLDDRLARAAQGHAQDMLGRSYYGHESPEKRGPLQRALAAGYRPAAVGENIARGELSVSEVLDGWAGSPGHRREMLDPGFTDVGFGFARGRSGDGYRILWVQLFGRER
jgi:uncharacterized protein YkwD